MASVTERRPPRRRRRRLEAGGDTERLHRHRFDRLVQRAIRSLPPRFAVRLENVAIVVADEATPTQRRAAGLRADEDLYGLYEGVPQPQRSAGYGMVLPDKITLFQRAIEADCRSEQEIARQVRHTLIHELAHHFGIDDARLDELGFD
jgi:predicted Zn-dependent protease with MMP-like domain